MMQKESALTWNPGVRKGLNRQAGMIGFITLYQSVPSQMTWLDHNVIKTRLLWWHHVLCSPNQALHLAPGCNGLPQATAGMAGMNVHGDSTCYCSCIKDRMLDLSRLAIHLAAGLPWIHCKNISYCCWVMLCCTPSGSPWYSLNHQEPPITENKSQRIEHIERIEPPMVCSQTLHCEEVGSVQGEQDVHYSARAYNSGCSLFPVRASMRARYAWWLAIEASQSCTTDAMSRSSTLAHPNRCA